MRLTYKRSSPSNHLAVDGHVPALSVRDLSVTYSGFTAVAKLDIDVPPGEIRGLIGPNGAGKTSCFNAICGYVKPTTGRVRVHGRAVRPYSPYSAWHAGIGRTFQRTELFWTLQVRDHLELARRRAVKRGATPPSVDETLSLLNLHHLQKSLVSSLPLGTCRLVELARAISTGANVILMDEPCSGLDAHETSQLETALRGIQTKLSLSLLIVEHDIEFILSMAQRILVLDHGMLIAEGTPREIRENSEVHRAYLGVPPENASSAHDEADISTLAAQ